ncbi:sulfatase-like hydrolase/transferase [bacterium]|nr:sulfatase-like hydrolase/transferase [bacterium]
MSVLPITMSMPRRQSIGHSLQKMAALCLTLTAIYLTTHKHADAQSSSTVRPPNIVVIIADDLGYGDVSYSGYSAVETPQIDRLAAEGCRFTSGYCSAATCTPTRFSLLTGTYAFRVKGTGIAAPNAPAVIKPGTETIASVLKQAGYATAAIGKWHLGLGEGSPDWNGELKPGPLEIGFDHCFLLPTTNDRVPQVFVQDHRVPNLDPADPLWVGNMQPSGDHPTGMSHRSSLKMDWSVGHNGTIHNGISRIGYYTGGMKARFRDEDLADTWVQKSIAWMETHRNQPFFLYFAAHDIHVPRIAHERFQGKSGLGPRGDCILEIDWCVGALMDALDRLQLAENTLVVFCSDNGPVLDDGYRDDAVEKLGHHKPAGPYRGGKYSVYEGGTRTPFITRWKGRIAPGESDQMVCTIDLPASMAALTGQTLPVDACLDSENFLPALLNQPGAKGRETLLQQDNGGGNFGLRSGNWKLVRQKARVQNKNVVNERPAQGDHLYDLTKDPGEQHDVAADHPEVLQRLQSQLDKIIADGRTRVAQ